MTYEEFIKTYLNKPRSKKVADFINFLMACDYESFIDPKYENVGDITFFLTNPNNNVTNVLMIEIINYKTNWVLKVVDNLHEIFEKAKGTTKINSLIEKLEAAFNEEKKTDDNIIISNLYDSLVKNYNKMSSSFKNICSGVKLMFSNTLKVLKDLPNNVELDNNDNTVFNLLKIFKYIDNKVQENLFEKIVILNTVASKMLEYVSTVHSEEPTSKDEVRITAESNPICYAHILPFYGGKCHRFHGHNGKLSITMISTKDFCKKRPMIVSYGFLKGFLKYVDNIMDHTTLIHVNNNVSLDLKDGVDLEVHLDTNNLSLAMTKGYNLIPNVEDIPEVSEETTSEITLVNFVIPLFKMYLLDFLLKESVDNTDLTMFGLEEKVKFEFTWGETDSTYCTIAFSI